VCDIAEENAQQKNGPAESYNPWPGYMFTGKLRPFPVVSLVNVLRQMLLSSIVVNDAGQVLVMVHEYVTD